MYDFMYSDDFIVNIIDPCLESIVNNDGAVTIADIDASGDQIMYSTPIQNGPSDSVATAYGDGYNLCDYLSYGLLDENNRVYASAGVVDVVPTR